MVVTVGFTVMALPVKLPGCHVYEAAPLAINTADWPGQIVGVLVVTETTGGLLTMAVYVAVAEQPLADTVTVYVPLVGGTINDVVALVFHK